MNEEENFKNMDNLNIQEKGPTPSYKRIIFWISIGLIVLASLIIIIYSISISNNSIEKRSPQNEDKKERINSPCNIGEDENSHTCYKNTEKCGSCNLVYCWKMEDVKLIIQWKQNIYYTDKDNVKIELINPLYKNNIIELIINGTLVDIDIKYKCKKMGHHTVLYRMNIEKLTSLNRLFATIKNVLSVTFTSLFNTKI